MLLAFHSAPIRFPNSYAIHMPALSVRLIYAHAHYPTQQLHLLPAQHRHFTWPHRFFPSTYHVAQLTHRSQSHDRDRDGRMLQHELQRRLCGIATGCPIDPRWPGPPDPRRPRYGINKPPPVCRPTTPWPAPPLANTPMPFSRNSSRQSSSGRRSNRLYCIITLTMRERRTYSRITFGRMEDIP